MTSLTHLICLNRLRLNFYKSPLCCSADYIKVLNEFPMDSSDFTGAQCLFTPARYLFNLSDFAKHPGSAYTETFITSAEI